MDLIDEERMSEERLNLITDEATACSHLIMRELHRARETEKILIDKLIKANEVIEILENEITHSRRNSTNETNETKLK